MARLPGSEGSQDGAYYRRLEVGPRATHDEIVRAYRRLALSVHSDAHPEDPDAPRRFREITEAYDVLADPARRHAYDRTSQSRRVPVLRCAATDDNPVGCVTGARTVPRGPSLVLGTPTGGTVHDVPLRVGPVETADADGAVAPRATSAELLFEILDSWWQQ